MVNIVAATTTLLFLTSPLIISVGGWFLIAPSTFNERAIALALCSFLFYGGGYVAYSVINNLKFPEVPDDKHIQQ